MNLQPYLFFEGRCDEAIAFYKKAVGAEVKMVMRYKDAPDPATRQSALAEKVMHCCLKIGDTEVLASDGHAKDAPEFKGFSLVINADSDAEAKRLFAALGKGGTIRMPLDKTFFASSFGMLADKFGVGWMVLVQLPQQAAAPARKSRKSSQRR